MNLIQATRILIAEVQRWPPACRRISSLSVFFSSQASSIGAKQKGLVMLKIRGYMGRGRDRHSASHRLSSSACPDGRKLRISSRLHGFCLAAGRSNESGRDAY